MRIKGTLRHHAKSRSKEFQREDVSEENSRIQLSFHYSAELLINKKIYVCTGLKIFGSRDYEFYLEYFEQVTKVNSLLRYSTCVETMTIFCRETRMHQ